MFEPVLLKNVAVPDSHLLSTYEAGGGYQALAKALREYTPDEVVNLVKQSNLRGRGGAGFPTGMKWSFVPKQVDKPKYLCCNADEGEPGTFKDRIIMERDPHQLIEGLAVSAYAIGAKTAYVYIRGEYVTAIRRLEHAIAEAHEKGYLGTGILGSNFDFAVHIHCGAGAYICGEETAMLESLEGKRAQPRLKPPFPAVAGLYASPTVINNVETLACVPHIVARGADWFRGIGPDKSPGPKLYCLSGQVRKPGLYELPMGIPLRELVEEHAGGALPGRTIKAVIPGGVSAPVIPEQGLDVRMDFDSLAAAGSMLGSAGVIVIDDSTCMVKVATRIIEFFHHESCGKCTPCREGLNWVVKVLRRVEGGDGAPGDLEQLEMLCKGIFGNTFCALGDGAAMGLRAALAHFRDEFVAHVEERRCPFH
ncbi:NADH oxidoreductase (quinone) subunit F [Rhizobium leguminosarum]|uniref:NADH-quinone oxidoreductase subunit NuoF n=1 Tax=Rhizobium leguminosarum TaxID=384 RepID=UPI00103138F9|nr:NADH-quinone oxidoreductase subunit NuoF [Rhizobium leguminosarum]QIO73967.1 NADH-quinone oxidoreductase subunit NuoF [Rhizobium leguminosarum bv. trifolii]QIO80986.1 NADH-quinone oxidoreductase subunit NuoF [Rhizobium leguminosarum bv. trifolii]TAU22520.1 NADH oxidoreductase (quinone) subunit F [Rhizobium leguminosarum]TAU42516.1 NADH oxidoreductase (quinone) subunit F [Rhizobium leguminosarum]TAV12941.1 NADH oxidoreductase (quinone) subunit F [Rhizobium leguminosarum]